MTHTPGARRATTLSLLLAVLAAVAVLVGLAASGGSAGAADRRAPTDDRAGAPAPAPAPSAARHVPQRATDATTDRAISPQMELDDTDAEHEARIGAWQRCLVENGATWLKDVPGPARAGIGPTPVAYPLPAGAKSACKDVEPILPVETNPNLNADYVADSEANVACLRAHGVAVHLYRDTSVYPDGLGWTYDASDTPLPDNQSQIERRCELQAFGD